MRITELRKKIGRTDLYIPDLHIEHGKIHGLTGPNGCGKTTLLKLIIGITQPDSGTIDLEGLRPTDITMTSQRPYLMHEGRGLYVGSVVLTQFKGQGAAEAFLSARNRLSPFHDTDR